MVAAAHVGAGGGVAAAGVNVHVGVRGKRLIGARHRARVIACQAAAHLRRHHHHHRCHHWTRRARQAPANVTG